MASAYIGVTDGDWFTLLRGLPDLDEINFWQPSGSRQFKSLRPGEPFLFKPHRRNVIIGGGFFAGWVRLPLFLAWESFLQKNGAATFGEMLRRVEGYVRDRTVTPTHEIGCILLEEPFFLDENEWIPIPDWHPNIVQGKRYDLASEPGRSLWEETRMRLQARDVIGTVGEPAPRFGEPHLVRPRLGQGSFRALVTDAYQRRCSITSEKVLPVLDAAHVRPYAEGGEHRVDNGILLRSDLHTLFDRGYVTVTPDFRVEVSPRLKIDFDNGKNYYALHGTRIAVPSDIKDRPNGQFLEWHNNSRFIA